MPWSAVAVAHRVAEGADVGRARARAHPLDALDHVEQPRAEIPERERPHPVTSTAQLTVTKSSMQFCSLIWSALPTFRICSDQYGKYARRISASVTMTVTGSSPSPCSRYLKVRMKHRTCGTTLTFRHQPDRKSTRLNSSHLGISYAV